MQQESKPNLLLGLDLAAAVLAVVGWLGVLALWLFTVPTADARWLFFMLGLSAMTGTLLPVVRHLNRRVWARSGTGKCVIAARALAGAAGCDMRLAANCAHAHMGDRSAAGCHLYLH